MWKKERIEEKKLRFEQLNRAWKRHITQKDERKRKKEGDGEEIRK